jgi:DNA-binding CsgD family transcriptional regulator
MPREHPLYSRSATILGQASFLRTAFSDAASAYSIAEATAQSDRDETEALHGFAVAAIFGETRRDEARRAVKRLAERKTRSPTDLVRYSIMDIARKRFDEGYAEALEIGDILRLLHLVDDPRVRTSFLYTCANALALRSEYDNAKKLIDPLMEDIEQFSLDFARPYANWTQALVALGRRRFGEAERLLQTVEDVATTTGDPGHHVNARSLRARLLLQTQQQAQALRLVSEDPPSAVMPSWKGEYFATRALAAACVGDARESAKAAKAASAHSTAIEVRVLGACARAIVGADTGETDLALAAWEQSRLVGGWDLLLTALRSAPAFANAIVARPATHAELEHLLTRSYDRSLAKRLGLRPRATRAPREVLSPREFEILGLIRRGLRTKEIAEALFISESTTKVHVRHIFEKLGVRTRAEAVARYEMFTDT